MKEASLVDQHRLRQVFDLFSGDQFSGQDVLKTRYDSLHAEISTRCLVLKHLTNPSGFKHLQRVAVASNYVSRRLSDVFARLYQIQWMKAILSSAKGDDLSPWYTIMGLALKDFHVDVASCMDSIAPLIIETHDEIKPKDQKALPGFADIQQGTRRTYRERLPSGAVQLIDSTNRWWPYIKSTRDILAHREHDRIIFGNPARGVLFQIYQEQQNPRVIDSAFLYKDANNVVDFTLYSAFVLGELLLLLEELALQICDVLHIPEQRLVGSMRLGQFNELQKAIGALAGVRG